MKLVVFADETRHGQLDMLLQKKDIAERMKNLCFYRNYDDFIVNLPRSICNTVIIAHKGALGMQGARAARILLHRVPVIWFSDDSDFVEESYKIGCNYFSAEPLTEELLNSALNRCSEMKGDN